MLEDHGGEVILGNPNAHKDKKLTLTVVKNPRKDSAMMQEEIFGPILPLITYKNLDEAIDFINEEHEKPLALYYFGKHNGPNQKRVMNETTSGTFASHEVIVQAASPFLPFGGVGHSGQGRYHGFEGFKAFSNMRSCLIKRPLDFPPFSKAFPPLPESEQAQIIAMIDKGMITQSQMANFCIMLVLIIIVVIFVGIYHESIF